MGDLLELKGNLFEVMKEIRDELGSPNDLTIRKLPLLVVLHAVLLSFYVG